MGGSLGPFVGRIWLFPALGGVAELPFDLRELEGIPNSSLVGFLQPAVQQRLLGPWRSWSEGLLPLGATQTTSAKLLARSCGQDEHPSAREAIPH